MNTANLELCKELYELSGWKDTGYFINPHTQRLKQEGLDLFVSGDLPAYDLGYLMRKLPLISSITHGGVDARDSKVKDYFWANSKVGSDSYANVQADTPEDAAASLAIELFKQGILTKEEIR